MGLRGTQGGGAQVYSGCWGWCRCGCSKRVLRCRRGNTEPPAGGGGARSTRSKARAQAAAAQPPARRRATEAAAARSARRSRRSRRTFASPTPTRSTAGMAMRDADPIRPPRNRDRRRRRAWSFRAATSRRARLETTSIALPSRDGRKITNAAGEPNPFSSARNDLVRQLVKIGKARLDDLKPWKARSDRASRVRASRPRRLRGADAHRNGRGVDVLRGGYVIWDSSAAPSRSATESTTDFFALKTGGAQASLAMREVTTSRSRSRQDDRIL